MTYLKAVLDETLRLYPPVPSNFKQAVVDDVLPNGYLVKKGTELQFNSYTVPHAMAIDIFQEIFFF